jgi:hypothetical protein
MMKSLLSATAAVFAASAAIVPAVAAGPGHAKTEASADQYAGMSVYDASGQEVGTIEKVVVAADGSEEAIVSVGGFLGIGSKKIAVPTSELTLNADSGGYTTSMTVEEIEAAPAYEADASDAM